ncbi:MAG: M23 family metallopeptidase [Chloroflexi bacterium]|uniref:M23 family metallopeptidase n=1 Tax=Candidatus Chlorohelix allophototropha TaxID=3003348 RepID=A0A8T7M6U0_9CHLR|nr:M23 family metallopeptidase [Chloroflexota bacterium]WJW69641.1 M23 family metallopeptidase [Chloroflexota bacterium L227-S17]
MKVIRPAGVCFTVVFLLSILVVPVPALAVTNVALDPGDSLPFPVATDPTRTYFPDTGHYLAGGFRTYWQQHGGLAQFGLPLSEEYTEANPADGKNYTVQYFERARFEYHPEFKGTPYEIELGLLGVQTVVGRKFDPTPYVPSTPNHYYFTETRHTLSAGFKRYWDSHGGLAIFGFPISEEFTEGGYTVQYFERNRFEYHPEFSGTEYEVLLGLLGTDSFRLTGHHLPQTFGVRPDSGAVVQGHTLKVRVLGSVPSNVTASFNGQKLTFVSQAGELAAYAPIVSNAALRPQLLRTEIIDNTGVVRRFDQNIGVLAGQFEHQTIQLDPAVESSLGSDEEQQRERDRDFSFYNQVTPVKLWSGRFSWPLTGPITTPFGSRRDYVGGGSEIHDAIDLGVPQGTPIRAPQRGIVVLAEFQKVRGGIVIIDHGLGVHSAYFHQSVIAVKVGDMLNQGDLIGKVGTTGLSTGAHLHWEIRIGAIGVDPEEWIKRDF